MPIASNQQTAAHSERSRIWYRTNAAIRYSLAHTSFIIPGQFVVNEFPKSGGTWLSQMLSQVSQIDYPRLAYPNLGRNILHGHFLGFMGIRNPILLWRDPRDVLVSLFFHCLHYRPVTSRANTTRIRSLMGLEPTDEVSIEIHFELFFELLQNRKIHPYFTLDDFYGVWFNRGNCFHTSYERLHDDAVGELVKCVRWMTGSDPDLRVCEEVVDANSFLNKSGRSPGVHSQKDFLRKGVVGDWKVTLGSKNILLAENALERTLCLFQSKFGTS